MIETMSLERSKSVKSRRVVAKSISQTSAQMTGLPYAMNFRGSSLFQKDQRSGPFDLEFVAWNRIHRYRKAAELALSTHSWVQVVVGPVKAAR